MKEKKLAVNAEEGVGKEGPQSLLLSLQTGVAMIGIIVENPQKTTSRFTT